MSSKPSLTDLLGRQFEVTQDFCNAQTGLRNALQRDGHDNIEDESVVQATLHYQGALYALQDLMHYLDQEYESHVQESSSSSSSSNSQNRRRLQLLKEHVQRTRRIVGSIASVPVVHPQGVLQTQSLSVEDMTLALSTLRASIRTLTQL
jgi:hypothetical protein